MLELYIGRNESLSVWEHCVAKRGDWRLAEVVTVTLVASVILSEGGKLTKTRSVLLKKLPMTQYEMNLKEMFLNLTFYLFL